MIVPRNWRLARRDLLKRLGLGAASLPLLPWLGDRRAQAEPAPEKKLICVLLTRGYRQEAWKPPVGPLQPRTLPASLQPLEPHHQDLVVLPDLTDAAVDSRHGLQAYPTILWGLPDVSGTGPYKRPNGLTLDQVVADGLSARPGAARRSALTLGVQLDLPPRVAAPEGRICSWRGAGTPIEPQGDPAALSRELFGPGSGDPATVKQLQFSQRSVLDYVGGSLQRFAAQVGSDNGKVVLAHLEALRGLESHLTDLAHAGCGSSPPMLNLTDRHEYFRIYQAQKDLMVAALTCGVSRVATLQVSDASGANIDFSFVPGIPSTSKNNYKSPYRNWGDLGHNPVIDGVDHKRIVDKWWMQQLAELLQQLKAIPDLGGSTLFDNTVVLWANTMDDGADENPQKLPWILAARAGSGGFRTGQCAASAGQPSSGVLAAICQAMGVPSGFGPPLPGLLA